MVKGVGAGQAGDVETTFPNVQRILAANVRYLRSDRRMTQERLAEVAEIDVRHVQRIEAGEANPQLDTLCLLAGALGTTPSELIALNMDKNGEPSSK